MFYITHTYVATKIVGEEPLVVIGSTIPDLPFFSSTLNPDEMHTKGLQFMEYLEKKDRSYVPLAIGIMLHGNTPTGLDFYTHKKPGYAYKHGQPLVEKIKKLRERLAPPGIVSPLTDEEIAHNFIEMGVEMLVTKEHPGAVKLFNNAIDEVDMKMIAKHLSDFFTGGTDEQDITDFYELFRPKKFTTLEGIVKTYPKILARVLSNMPDKAMHGAIPDQAVVGVSSHLKGVIKKMMPEDRLRAITEQAVEIVKPTYEQFLTKSIDSMRVEMEKLGFA